MSDIEAIEVLTQAKERLFECGWGSGSMGEREDVPSLCLEEALAGKGFYIETEVQIRAGRYVRRGLGLPTEGGQYNVWVWNDCNETAGPVFDAIDCAIQIAKESPTPS